MNLPVSLLTWLAAIAPIALLLVLLIRFRWGVSEASPLSLMLAVILGITLFGAPLPLIAGELAKGIWNGISVMAVVIPAILIFEVTNEAGGFEPFRKGMQRFSPNELLQILTVGWVFSSFLQGITGFGVPVAIVAPLLVGMGVRPFWAVIIPLLGRAWGTTFGTLAVAWEALILQAGIPEENILATAAWGAAFTWLIDLAAGLLICWFYARGEGLKKGFIAVACISLLHGGGQLILTQFNQTLCNFLASSLALLLAYLLGKMPAYASAYRAEHSPMMNRAVTSDTTSDSPDNLTFFQSFLPYTILTAITLLVLLVPQAKQALSFLVIGFAFPETSTSYNFVNAAVPAYAPINVFTHAGTFLVLSSVIGYFFFKAKGSIASGGAVRICKRTFEKAAPSTIAVILLICMARVMGGTGQVLVLAKGTAMATGVFYAVFSPFIGLLGAFMTSSCMASNILFGDFQQTMAELLNFNSPLILGAQTGGASIGNVLCPSDVLLGTTTAGILGMEGEILKKVIPVGCAVCLLCGLIVFIVQMI